MQRHLTFSALMLLVLLPAVVAATDRIVSPPNSLPDSVLNARERAHTLLDQVLAEQRFLESLDAQSVIELPVGIVKSGSAFDYSILIDRMTFTPEGAQMDVYVSLALPQGETRLAFHGKIPLSAQGGIAGKARVYLLGDHTIAIDETKLLTVKERESYVEFDCSGFLGVNIAADLEVSRDLLVPEDQSGHATAGRLRLSFTTYTQSLNDILVKITIPPFQVAGLNGFGFYATSAWLDWSDLVNIPGLTFPEAYESSLFDAGLPNLWRGLFLEEVELRLPPAFARRQTSGRIAVGLRGALIDDQGLSGTVYTKNVLPEGDMAGWRYTIDELRLNVLANRVSGFAFTGEISVPVVADREGEPAYFDYRAHLSADGNYLFAVDVGGDLTLDLWKARLRLFDGSSITVLEKEGHFFPSARLSGELAIDIPGDGPKPRFNSLRFENMIVNSEAPYFVPGTFGFGAEGDKSQLSGFPVAFDNITIKSDESRVGLAFDMLVNISGSPENESFAAKGNLTVWGKQSGEPIRDARGEVVGINRYAWQYDKVEISTVRLNIKKPRVFELSGELRFFEGDELYGEGFRGTVKGKLQSIAVHAQALFGRTDSFRYWYADALVEMKNGVPLVPGALSAFGFGGGYYSRMRQTTEPLNTALAKSPSGITYVPDESSQGIRAMVLIGTPRPEAMRGDVALEMAMNRHGGINSVTFTGNANFMSAASLSVAQVKELAAAAVDGNLSGRLERLTRGQVFGRVKLHFDNVNDIFHGNLEIFVNVAGGIVRGVSQGNKAGWAELHFARDTWHILVGTPDQPLGLEVARLFKAKSYFMLGKHLPGSPPPPPQVSEILGGVDLDYMRDLNALESGMGIALGLHFLVDTGDLRFLMFYGRFSAGTGLDFMLKDFGTNYHCAGMSGPIGINGWYANGQAYAFLTGKIGIKVNLRFYKGTYDILSIGAAAVLQAKGPNPFWMKGTVGGYYRLLGGLVKGNCRFEVTIGKDCKPVGEQSLIEEVSMIAGISPVHGATDVDVFAAPQVAFNIPVGEVFEITDIESKTHAFRAVLEEFVVESGGRPLTGKLRWNAERDVAIFEADNILPGEAEITARAVLVFEEKRNGNWQTVQFDGSPVKETVTTDFRTARAPELIPLQNILFAYPFPDQVNFHPREYSQGYIQLKIGQPDLFDDTKEWRYIVSLNNRETGQVYESPLEYHKEAKRITFSIPQSIPTNAQYAFAVIALPQTDQHIDENVVYVDREIRMDASAGSASLTERVIENTLVRRDAKHLFESHVRTSRYQTFAEKMRDLAPGPAFRLSSGINIFRLTAELQTHEGFGPREVAEDDGLIRLEANLKGNSWYERHVYPLLYNGYPIDGWMHVRRSSAGVLGVPPVRDIQIANAEPAFRGRSDAVLFPGKLVYRLGESVAADFFDLRNQAANYIADHPGRATDRLSMLVLKPLPYLRYGRYRVRATYVLPGIGKETSTHVFEIFNRIPDND